MEAGGKASVNTLKSADPSSIPSDYKITGTYHVHPKGERNGFGFYQPPSPGDLSIIQNTAKRGNGNHFVLAARHKKVYIYNSNGVIATFPLKSFIKK